MIPISYVWSWHFSVSSISYSRTLDGLSPSSFFKNLAEKHEWNGLLLRVWSFHQVNTKQPLQYAIHQKLQTQAPHSSTKMYNTGHRCTNSELWLWSYNPLITTHTSWTENVINNQQIALTWCVRSTLDTRSLKQSEEGAHSSAQNQREEKECLPLRVHFTKCYKHEQRKK